MNDEVVCEDYSEGSLSSHGMEVPCSVSVGSSKIAQARASFKQWDENKVEQDHPRPTKGHARGHTMPRGLELGKPPCYP